MWNDPELGIVWPEMDSEPLLSAKDRAQMSFREFKDSFGGFCL
jgi:dTDP-4-dehydrorhamnose 3,5-epimerase-like enzyme